MSSADWAEMTFPSRGNGDEKRDKILHDLEIFFYPCTLALPRCLPWSAHFLLVIVQGAAKEGLCL